MLYKVTPMMAPEPAKKEKKPREPGQPRKRRRSAVYDHEGHEVLISLMCLKCRQVKPLMQFGLRKMADGAIRNQPWCRGCRSGAGTRPPRGKGEEAATVEVAELDSQEVEAPLAPVSPPMVAEPPIARAPASPASVDAGVVVELDPSGVLVDVQRLPANEPELHADAEQAAPPS